MSPYPLNLPIKLQQKAEKLAAERGISLDRFILSAVAEKVGTFDLPTDDPSFPDITYRRGASGQEVPVLGGTSLRVQTIYIAAQQWGLSPHQIADEYDLTEAQVHDALAFAAAHRQEIETAIAAEQAIEAAHV
ncbi:MAG: DUF433 domain-containing protein [Hormoscilla sp.]